MNYNLPDQDKQTIQDTFKILYDKGYLIQIKDNKEINKIHNRTISIMQMSEMKYIIFDDDDLLKKYEKFWMPYNITRVDIYNDFVHQIASCMLSIFELIKKFLLRVLDLDKLKLKEKSMLGEIISKINSKCDYPKNHLTDLFDIKTRNIIAHDNWYYKEKNFAYKNENDNEVEITLEKLVEKIKRIIEINNQINIICSWSKPAEFSRNLKNYIDFIKSTKNK